MSTTEVNTNKEGGFQKITNYISSYFYTNNKVQSPSKEKIDEEWGNFLSSKFAKFIIRIEDVRRYVDYINKLKLQGYNVQEIPRLEEFREFCGEDNICIGDAQILDKYFTGNCGGYWLRAYGVPKEGEMITGTKFILGKDNLRAVDVGIFTFSIVEA